MAKEIIESKKQPDPVHYLSMINRGFTGINAAILDLRTGASDEQIEALDVFQASMAGIQETEAHSVRSVFHD